MTTLFRKLHQALITYILEIVQRRTSSGNWSTRPYFSPRASFLPSFELPRAHYPSVTYPLPSRPSPVVVYLILLPSLGFSFKTESAALSSYPSQPEPRRQICRVKSQMNTHSATEGNQRCTGHTSDLVRVMNFFSGL